MSSDLDDFDANYDREETPRGPNLFKEEALHGINRDNYKNMMDPGQNYPSSKMPIKVGDRAHANALGELRKAMNKLFIRADDFNNTSTSSNSRGARAKHTNSIPNIDTGTAKRKNEMMIGDGIFSGQKRIKNGKEEIEPFEFSYNDFNLINTGKPTGKVVDLITNEKTEVTWSRSCAAQKLFAEIAKTQEYQSGAAIQSISMIEKFFIPDGYEVQNRGQSEVYAVQSCSYCAQLLPVATGGS